MKIHAGFFRLWLLLSCFSFFPTLTAQILQQDFEGLSSIEEFKGKPPNQGQVDNIDLEVSNTNNSIFSLGLYADDQHLLIRKEGKQLRYFLRQSGINNLPAIKVSFEFLIHSGSDAGKLAGLYLGDSLNENSFYPNNERRWSQIGIYGTNDGKFYLRNELRKEHENDPTPYNGETKVLYDFIW